LELGKKLIQELGLEQSTDTLARWMAHHVAELIARAEKATGADKSVAESECFTAILALWARRSQLPNGRRPFEELEPVLRAVEALDPENDKPRYYRTARPPQGESAETTEQDEWLKLADGLDYSARVLIGYCLTEAAGTALDKAKEWVKLSTAINGAGAPEFVIRFLLKESETSRAPDPQEGMRALLEDRAKRLRGFVGMAEKLANTLDERRRALAG